MVDELVNTAAVYLCVALGAITVLIYLHHAKRGSRDSRHVLWAVSLVSMLIGAAYFTGAALLLAGVVHG